jgi:hypothetical protein
VTGSRGVIRLLPHAVAVVAFAVVAVICSFPLVTHLDTHIPGSIPGDNVSFLWNVWWMRVALASHQDFFHTTYLFAPVGTDLSLHTHMALPALIAATLFGRMSPVQALNVTVLLSLWLNGVTAYAVSWRLTRSAVAASIGGVIFSTSPFMAAHLNGHFNLTAAWVLPLFAIAWQRALTGSRRWIGIAGLWLGVIAYVDYYYFVYAAILAICFAVASLHAVRLARRRATPGSQRAARIVYALTAVVGLMLIAIVITGGFRAQLGPLVLSMRSTFNALQVFWVLMLLAVWLRFRPAITFTARGDVKPREAIIAFAAVAALALVVALPLLWHGIQLFARGDYVTQQYFWRSAPKGIDVATILLGNPFNPLLRAPLAALYATAHIDAIETVGWLGLVPMGLVLSLWWRRETTERPSMVEVRQSPEILGWALVAVVFFLWALGPHMMVFGENTGVILPQAVIRYVPILNNARIPGRAIVLVYLPLGVFAAMAVARLSHTGRIGAIGIAAILIGISVDYLPAPVPLLRLDHPKLYDEIRKRPEQGAVCELPLGLRDGFGERGRLDGMALYYQTIHQRPLVGGFVARLAPSVTSAYERDPLLSVLVRLSSPESGPLRSLPDRELAVSRLRADGIRFIVLDRAKASPQLVDYVRTLQLELVTADGDRDVYLVAD